MSPLGTFQLTDLVISSPGHQHPDLIEDIPLGVQLSVSDELIEEVQSPIPTGDGRWRPKFVTELPITVPRYRITVTRMESGLKRRTLGFVELTGAEVFANFLSLWDRYEGPLIEDVVDSPPLLLSFSPTFSFLGFSGQRVLASAANALSGLLPALAEEDFDYLHNAILLVTPSKRLLLLLDLAQIVSRQWCNSCTSAERDRGIAAVQDAVALTDDSDPSKIHNLYQLAVWLHARHLHTRDSSDIHQAVSILEKARKLAPADHPLRLKLDILLRGCYPLLPRSLDKGRAETVPGGPMDHLLSGVGLLVRGMQSGDVSDLDQAILHLRRSLSSPKSSEVLGALGTALIYRYRRFHDPRDLDEVINTTSQVLARVQVGDPFPPFADSLIQGLVERFDLTYNDDDITRAIDLSSTLIRQIPDSDHRKVVYLGRWATAYGHRYSHTNDIQDLDRAISIYDQAAKIESATSFQRTAALSSYAQYLCLRSQRYGDPASLHKAINAQSRAIELAPETYPDLTQCHEALGRMYLHRGRISQHCVGDIKKAFSQFSVAANMRMGPPIQRYDAASMWAGLAHIVNDPSHMEAYNIALELLPKIAWLGLSLEQRHKQLTGAGKVISAATITLDAAAAAVEQCEYEKAVEWLEQGRSIVWGQLLQLRTPVDALCKAHPDIANRLARLSDVLQHYPSAGWLSMEEGAAENHRQATMDREKLVEEIRTLPDFEGFLKPRTLAQLGGAAVSGPIVMLNASEHRCDALILLPGLEEVLYVPLPNFTRASAQKIQSTLTRLLRNSGRSVESDRAGKRYTPHKIDADTEFAQCLKDLWDNVVKPVLDGLALTSINSFDLDDLPRVWWCPTGPLSSLPLHAAGNYAVTEPGSKASDYVVSSYTPTIGSLIHDSDPTSTNPPKILAIAQPYSFGQQELPGTLDEVNIIAQRGRNCTVSQLVALDATIEAVSTEMKDANWVHFACHGVQSALRPADSALLLADTQRLRLSEIIKMNLPNGQLAFLSACQTAKGTKDLPDEAVHLAAGMLMAGFRGVIATMWSIGDADAPQIAGDVYGALLEGEGVPDHRNAAKALHLAVKRLREGYGNKSFLRWMPYIHIGA